MMRFLVVILAPLLLVGCILTPGKFTSTMTINTDRTFAFTYKGEVYAIDPSSALKGIGEKPATDETPAAKPAISKTAAANTKRGKTPEAAPDADTETKNREIAAALSKEVC
jgi:hypothetical protein